MRVHTLFSPAARAAAAVTAALSMLLVPVLAAGPALAGGPTSVLLSAPAIGHTASLYTSDPEYTALAELVGASMALGTPDEQAGSTDPARSHNAGNQVTLTWLIHDVSVWRVDRVYVDAAGGPWISTQQAIGGTDSIWDAPETWHRATEPKALAQLLGSLGLLGGTSDALPGEATTSGTAPSAQQDAASAGAGGAAQGNGNRSAADAATGATGDGFSPALAALLGFVAGALAAGVVSVALVRRSETRLPWAQVDLEASTGDVVGSDGALTRR